MTVYPYAIDDDTTLIRVDDNITELGGQAIAQIRDAIFAIESELGLQPAGSAGSIADRLDRSLDANGDIKASALTSIGLVTLPITDNQVASTAGIKESKLTLDYSTSNLNTLILAHKVLLDSVSGYTAILGSNLSTHIGGGQSLANGSPARHVASHIDINAVPSDPRDVTFVWTGINDKDGNPRAATNMASGLQEVNDALTYHENLVDNAHPATAITVDTTNFTEIPAASNTVQKALDAIDNSDRLQIGNHRATMHWNGIPRAARTEQILIDGYSDNIVPPTPITTFLVDPPATGPVDNNVYGDDIIQFQPVSNADFKFDEKFTQVKVGDIVSVNYGNGIEARFPIESIRFLPGSSWFVRINGLNLFNTDGYTAYGRIDRPAFNTNTRGVLAVAAANNDIDGNLLGSVIVSHPRGATAFGVDFDPNQIDSTHYKLWLHLYPTGNPVDKIIQLPAIDVTGNAGVTPGQYTLSRIVASTNDALRASGYNYRFIAFAHEGNFGIMLADPIGNASFSIVSGTLSGASLIAGTYTQNVVGDAVDGQDALGLGATKAALASPSYNSSFASAEAATNQPTILITPLRNRHYVVNGVRKDNFIPTVKANADGYWDAVISARVPIGVTTIEVSYTVDMDLCESGLKAGKTIVVQPAIAFGDASYLNADYGRFIIKSVTFTAPCDPLPGSTVITVVNGVHSLGTPIGSTSDAGLPVRLYFGADSVGFNAANVINAAAPGTAYNRFHEIYVDEEGHTFSHERARMPKQSATAQLLGTSTNWTIRDVSPKLRGFRDDASVNLNKYVRFFVLNYNDTTGEYDGYIGKRDPANPLISKYGEVVRARKNVPSRFYDETNIDFIEIEFFDDTISTGTPVMPVPYTTERYVDIEIFPTLREDEEFFYIASVEVDDKYIDTVTDRREFGNVSERNLTLSAIQFIEAGDRYLHTNGVIRGFDYQGVDPNNSNRILFDGGIAVVNGHISAVNAGAVAIPEIIPDGTAVPQSLTWAICVNDKNEFVAIPITVTKEQFFAQMPGAVTNYYVPSVTFVELISSRKDLTPIYIANITVSSFTVNDMSDARRYVANETGNIPFTWMPAITNGDGETKLYGSFESFAALQTWINYYGSTNNTVKVRGTFTIGPNGTLPMNNFTQPVTFEGENAVFNVTALKGITLGSNITFRGITFNYNPDTTYTAGDVVNVGNACLYTEGMISNVVIEKCKFITDEGGQIHPFINFHASAGFVDGSLYWTNIFIRENTFLTYAAVSQAAIAFTNAVIGAFPGVILTNVKIDDNYCSLSHGIYVTSIFASGAGLVAKNCSISRNKCGTIGYITSGLDSGASLSICENNCSLIATLDPEGDFTSGVLITYSTGYVKINNNKCNWIYAACTNDSSEPEFGATLISENTLSGSDTTFINTNHGVTTNVAILVHGQAASNVGVATIVNNSIELGTALYADNGISVANCGVIINSNTIGGATGVTCDIVEVSTDRPVTITSNQLCRGAGTINSYITGGSSTGAGLITDNIFDDYTVDGASNISLVINAPASWVVERNKNQTVDFSLGPVGLIGTFALKAKADGYYIAWGDTILSSLVKLGSATNLSVLGTTIFDYNDNGLAVFFNWTIPLDAVLPANVYVVRAAVDVTTSTTFGTTGNFTARLYKNSDDVAGNTVNFASSAAPGTSTVTAPDTSYNTGGANYPHLQLVLEALSATANQEVTIDNVIVRYRY